MRDHFVLLVDRLLTDCSQQGMPMPSSASVSVSASASAYKHDDIIDFSSHRNRNRVMDDDNVASSPSRLVECRICHDEDEDLNMEIPCSCRGSLMYAHRKCVQRWCNEKGNITYEICHQQFKPGYTAPPPLFHYGNVPMNLRRDLPAPNFITTDDRGFLEPDIDDYSAPSSPSLMCCRVIAIIFMVLLVLRHTLPIIISGAGDYSLTLFTLLMLRGIGIMLPVCIMVKAFTAIQRRRHHQDPRFSLDASDEESDISQLQQPHSRLIHSSTLIR